MTERTKLAAKAHLQACEAFVKASAEYNTAHEAANFASVQAGDAFEKREEARDLKTRRGQELLAALEQEAKDELETK